MRQNKARGEPMSAAELLEEALGILRESPQLLAWYCIGSLPFMLGLLFFLNDMLMSAFAFSHLAQASLGMVILFIWMKVWQSFFSDRITAYIKGEPYKKAGFRQIINACMIQAAIQPWGFIILPASFLIMLPFGKAYAFFQNVSVKGNGSEPDVMKVARISSRLADYAPKQNFIAIWLASPFQLFITSLFIFILVPVMRFVSPGVPPEAVAVLCMFVMLPVCIIGILVSLNIGATLLLLPYLLKTLFDVETPFSMSTSSFANSTFLALVWCLSYLAIDPVMKTAYALRCFYAESIRTGDDILVSIRRPKTTAILTAVVVLLFIHGQPIHAEPPAQASDESAVTTSVSPAKLDRAIDSVLKNPEYSWRMPREKPEKTNDDSGFLSRVISSVGHSIADWINKAWDRLKNMKKLWDKLISWLKPKSPGDQPKENPGLALAAKVMIVLGLAVIAAVAALLIFRTFKERSALKSNTPAGSALVPDIASADTIATDMSRDGWLDMAKDLMDKGELRLSLRAFYLSTLAFLSESGLIMIARYKSDTDYANELGKKDRTPALNASFDESIRIYQRSWYGMHDVTPAVLDGFMAVTERIRQDGQV